MTFQILNQINDLQSRLLGYCTLLAYRYMNLCVKAEPAALLSSKVILEDNEYRLEEVASVAIPNAVQYYIYPVDKAVIPQIQKALLLEHPEFKQEIKDGDKDKIIVLTVPPVDKDRKDAILDMVDALHKDCDLRMKTDYDVAATKVGMSAVTLPKESQDEAKEEVKKAYDSFVEKMNQYKDVKTKEVEDAYSRYLEEHEEQAQVEKEQEEAEGIDNIFKMTLDD